LLLAAGIFDCELVKSITCQTVLLSKVNLTNGFTATDWRVRPSDTSLYIIELFDVQVRMHRLYRAPL